MISFNASDGRIDAEDLAFLEEQLPVTQVIPEGAFTTYKGVKAFIRKQANKANPYCQKGKEIAPLSKSDEKQFAGQVAAAKPTELASCLEAGSYVEEIYDSLHKHNGITPLTARWGLTWKPVPEKD